VNYLVSSQWDSNLIETLHITGIGNLLYTNYFLWLILASIILLLAMVGTIIITIKQ
jgi:NADH-ubiquinone oxidoreductase chain 6